MLKEKIINTPTNLDNLELLMSVARIYKKNLNKENWCITERLNGINLSIITDGKEIVSSNNKYFIKINDKTFIPELYEYLIKKYNFKYLQLFGKIIGGTYTHKNVKNNHIKSIFKKPNYCPNINFII